METILQWPGSKTETEPELFKKNGFELTSRGFDCDLLRAGDKISYLGDDESNNLWDIDLLVVNVRVIVPVRKITQNGLPFRVYQEVTVILEPDNEDHNEKDSE